MHIVIEYLNDLLFISPVISISLKEQNNNGNTPVVETLSGQRK